MSNGVIAVTLSAIVVLLAGGLFVLNLRVADRRLARWAVQAGYQVVWKRRCWLRRGPFAIGWAEGSVIYRLCLRGGDGYEQLAWARCCTGLFPLGKIVEFRPDEPPGFPVILKVKAVREGSCDDVDPN